MPSTKIDQFFKKFKPSTIKGIITLIASGTITIVSVTVAIVTYFTSNIHEINTANLKLQFETERMEIVKSLNNSDL